jgi:hypothetical protein
MICLSFNTESNIFYSQNHGLIFSNSVAILSTLYVPNEEFLHPVVIYKYNNIPG